MDHHDIRDRIQRLKTFYTNVTIYVVVFLLSIIVWLCMGAGSFWPIWIAIGCGIAAFSEALRIDHLPILKEYLPFLSKDWEKEQEEKIHLEKKRKDHHDE